MPHLVKKIVNAFERSGEVKSTDLQFRGQPVTLKMLQQLWLSEQNETKIGSLRTNFITEDHWPPRTSFHRMKVFLATQVVSATIIRLLDTYADKCGGVAKYAPIRVIVANIDRLVDICNNTRTNSRGVVKGCEQINSPHHFHLQELINILEVFAEWKAGAKTKSNFIPYQSYEDLIQLVTTLIGISTVYLKEDKSRTMVQRRGGSDDCEHEFGGIRERNAKPAALDMQQGLSRRTGTRTSTFNALSKANTSGDTGIYTSEITGTLTRK